MIDAITASVLNGGMTVTPHAAPTEPAELTGATDPAFPDGPGVLPPPTVPPAPSAPTGPAAPTPPGQSDDQAPPAEDQDDGLLLPHNPADDDEDTEDSDDDEEEKEADDDGANGSCFVATAAYGDRLHHEVVWLRNWRDTVLVRSVGGRAFIRFYWKIGPVMARYVQPDRRSGRLFRGLIRGIIRVLRHIH
jgi:hypothetical protein